MKGSFSIGLLPDEKDNPTCLALWPLDLLR